MPWLLVVAVEVGEGAPVRQALRAAVVVEVGVQQLLVF
jgi:hypothetical protein